MTTELVVRDDPENHRYLLEVDGEVVGIAVYHLRGGRYFFVHTEVDPEHEKRLTREEITAALQERGGDVEVYQQTRSILGAVQRLYEVGSPVPATLILLLAALDIPPVEEVVNSLRPLLGRHRIEVAPAVRLHALADPPRLRQILDRVKPKQHGVIVRTAAEGVTDQEIELDVRRLLDAEVIEHYQEVAARMFLSVKTIEASLTRIYRKLGIRYVSGTGILAKLFLNEFRESTFPQHVHFTHGDVEVVDLHVGASAHGMTVEDFEMDGRLRVAAVQRGSRTFIPRPEDRLELGREPRRSPFGGAVAEFRSDDDAGTGLRIRNRAPTAA